MSFNIHKTTLPTEDEEGGFPADNFVTHLSASDRNALKKVAHLDRDRRYLRIRPWGPGEEA